MIPDSMSWGWSSLGIKHDARVTAEDFRVGSVAGRVLSNASGSADLTPLPFWPAQEEHGPRGGGRKRPAGMRRPNSARAK